MPSITVKLAINLVVLILYTASVTVNIPNLAPTLLRYLSTSPADSHTNPGAQAAFAALLGAALLVNSIIPVAEPLRHSPAAAWSTASPAPPPPSSPQQ